MAFFQAPSMKSWTSAYMVVSSKCYRRRRLMRIELSLCRAPNWIEQVRYDGNVFLRISARRDVSKNYKRRGGGGAAAGHVRACSHHGCHANRIRIRSGGPVWRGACFWHGG